MLFIIYIAPKLKIDSCKLIDPLNKLIPNRYQLNTSKITEYDFYGYKH